LGRLGHSGLWEIVEFITLNTKGKEKEILVCDVAKDVKGVV
jgi:hypothetical protein